MENTSNLKNYFIIGLVIALFLMTFQCHNSQGSLAELEKDKTEIELNIKFCIRFIVIAEA